ncbi:hypothetical protein C4559_01235 [Candidatus Microgenomates bacterium]|nr:MAG: hypothetical protein C4559_01235 [Candidatus Microgenomates bacterium]
MFLENIQNITSLIKGINFNFLDIIILIVLLFYAFEGYALGFVASFLDFASFIFSFVIGLRFYSFFGNLIAVYFSVPKGFANAIGFFLAAFLFEIIFSIIFRKLQKLILSKKKEKNLGEKKSFGQKLNHLFGIIPGIASALVLLSFLLTVIISLPFSPFLKHAVSSSKLGLNLVANAAGLEKKINEVFGGAVSETINFLTVKPEGDEFVKLNFKTENTSIDQEAERKMLELVNKERTSRGLNPLEFDESLRDVARKHSEDMFKRGYFSHYTPEGVSPFDRMAKANIVFISAGENLALAPNVDLAMQGLMNSPGHKANILSQDFGTIGIGVVDGGIYGEMFSQEFTN